MRYVYIDAARGIAILLVVLGHCFPSAECGLNRMILSFHVPLFFFLSGIFAKPMTAKTIAGGLISKIKVLLVPHLVLSFTLIILNSSLWVADGNNLLNFDIVPYFFYWFLPVLFSCSFIFMLLSVLMDVKRVGIKIAIIVGTAICIWISIKFSCNFSIKNLYWIRIIPTAFFFYYCGFCLKEKTLVENNNHTILQGLALLFLAAVLFILSQINNPVKMYENFYGNYFLFLITSFIGIYIVMIIARLVQNANLMKYMGRYSIAIYVWNFLIIGVFYRLTTYVMMLIGGEYNGIRTAITFGVSIIVLYAIAWLTYEKFSFLYGVSNKNKKIK